MPTLREVQRGFLAAVLHGEDDALDGLVLGAGLSPAERVGIYRNNALTSLAAALAAVYPVIERLVGADFFAAAARAYARAQPSRSGNLHDFGAEFPGFLARRRGMEALPYAADVARLEWAWHHAFHAAGEAAFPFAALAAVAAADHGDLRFVPARSASLLDSPHPFVRIWRANQAPPGEEPAVDLAAGAERALVVRVGGEVRVRGLGPGEHALLGALAADRPLAAAVAAARSAEPALDVSACLGSHVGAGTLTDFHH